MISLCKKLVLETTSAFESLGSCHFKSFGFAPLPMQHHSFLTLPLQKVIKIKFLLTISIHHKVKRLQELMQWSPNWKILWSFIKFFQPSSILKCVEIVQQSFLCMLTFYQYHYVVSAWAVQCISGMNVLDLLLFSSSLL